MNYERKGWELEDVLCEGLGSSAHSMIDCDPACQRVGVGGVITSTFFFFLFTLPLLAVLR